MRTFSRLILLACLFAGSPLGPGALAQTYPDRTVTIVVTSAAGALTDVLTRAVAQRLSQMWGQNVIVENRGGGGHTLAAGARVKGTLAEVQERVLAAIEATLPPLQSPGN